MVVRRNSLRVYHIAGEWHKPQQKIVLFGTRPRAGVWSPYCQASCLALTNDLITAYDRTLFTNAA